MTGPVVQGWCPGALRPMPSGDGLLVRVRPFGGRLEPDQADGLATLSTMYGNGLIDFSNRANVQIRGVSERSHSTLIEGLRDLRLIDETEAQERRRNVIISPFREAGDATDQIAAELTKQLMAADLALPAKFGFAVDAGPFPVLQHVPTDIRIERAEPGLLLVPEGHPFGKPVTEMTAATEAIALAHWFDVHRGAAKRMRDLQSLPRGFDRPRTAQTFVPVPGIVEGGVLVACAFGQIQAKTLEALAKHGALRVTPWRMLLVEWATALPQIDGLITDPDEPLLRVVACKGAPGCAQALGETRRLARSLAGLVPEGQLLHVTGCTKNCAHPSPLPLKVTATARGYDLSLDGVTRNGLSATDIERALNAT